MSLDEALAIVARAKQILRGATDSEGDGAAWKRLRLQVARQETDPQSAARVVALGLMLKKHFEVDAA